MDQIDCTKITIRSAVMSLLVLLVVDIPSGAMAAQLVAGSDRQLLPEPNRVFAQAGSTGGILGKQDKSVSGDQDTDKPRRRERASSQRRERNQPEPRAMASLRYDGAWRGASTGSCIAINPYNWTVQVRNGIMSGSDTDGRVTSGGALTGTMIVFGKTYKFHGHMGSSQMSGTWTRPDGCGGTWTGSKAGD
jgi:hypothetical protein